MSHACFHVTGLGLFACHMLVSMSPACLHVTCLFPCHGLRLVCMSHTCFHVTGLGLFACHMLVSMSRMSLACVHASFVTCSIQHCCIFLPSAANQSCLSPQFINDRPVLREDAPLITNTSIFLAWDISVPLPEFCNNVVFSIPSFTYMLEYRLRTNDIEPLFQTVGITRD